MENEEYYEPDLLSVTDEDGNEIVFELLERYETDDDVYVAITEYHDVAEEIVENCYSDELTEFAKDYFDYYKYAQYLLDGNFCETPHGILELM